MTQYLDWRKWLLGLSAAFIGGGAGAVVSGLTSMGIAPDKFNLSSGQGVGHVLEMMGANALVNGIISLALYLKQSPVPAEVSVETTTVSQTVTKSSTPSATIPTTDTIKE